MLVRMHITPWNTRADIDHLWRPELEPVRAAAAAGAPELFGGMPPARHRLALGLVMSVTLHGAAIALAGFAAHALVGICEVQHRPRYAFQDISIHPALHGGRLPMPSAQTRVDGPAAAPIPERAKIVAHGDEIGQAFNTVPAGPAAAIAPRRDGPLPDQPLSDGALPDGVLPDGSIQILHPPDGVADVVLEGADGDLAPEIRQLLPDGPVHTVYCAVGAAREWVVHYSVPDAEPQIEFVNSMVIRLPDVARIAAPYPLITIVPASLTGPQKERVTIYAELDTAGRLHNVRLVKGPAAVQSLWEKLSNWLFRPAARNGSAVGLKLILVVPAANAGEVG